MIFSSPVVDPTAGKYESAGSDRPQRTPGEMSESEAASQTSYPDSALSEPSAADMPLIRVLIADDHMVVREGTRRLLEQTNDLQVVGEASDGQDAVDLVARLRPDVALLDIAMPRLNGIEATRLIKKSRPATGVLVLTAYDDDQYVFALLEAGAAGYLLKDVRGGVLIDAIRSVYSGEPVLHPAIERKVLRYFAQGAAAISDARPLSDREVEVLALAARGLGNKEIAAKLGLSVRTIQAHLTHIFSKLGVASRTEAVILCLRRRWLDLEDLDASDD